MDAPNRDTQLLTLRFQRHTVKNMQAVLRYYGQRPGGRRLKADIFLQLQTYVRHRVRSREERNIITRFFRGGSDLHQMQRDLDQRRGIQQPAPRAPAEPPRQAQPVQPVRLTRQRPGEDRRSRSPIIRPQIQSPSPPPPAQQRAGPVEVIVLHDDPVSQPRECTICAVERELNEFPARNPTSRCDHETTACLNCVRNSIEQNINDLSRIECPECNEGLQFEDVKALASPEQFARFDRFQMLEVINKDPLFIQCLGPDCDSGQIHSGGEEEPIVTCNECGFRTCFTHKLPWHSGQTCEEFDTERQERTEQEEASQLYLKRVAKTCPNTACCAKLEKAGGCNHFTCSRCHHQFCWLCFAVWGPIDREGLHHHERTCSLWRPGDDSDEAPPSPPRPIAPPSRRRPSGPRPPSATARMNAW